jgi:hypothetical protein
MAYDALPSAPASPAEAAVGGELPVAVSVGSLEVATEARPPAEAIDAALEPVIRTLEAVSDARNAWRSLSLIGLGSGVALFTWGLVLDAQSFAMAGAALGTLTLCAQLPYAALAGARRRTLFRELSARHVWLTRGRLERAYASYQLSETALQGGARRRSRARRRKLLREMVRRVLAGD